MMQHFILKELFCPRAQRRGDGAGKQKIKSSLCLQVKFKTPFKILHCGLIFVSYIAYWNIFKKARYIAPCNIFSYELFLTWRFPWEIFIFVMKNIKFENNLTTRGHEPNQFKINILFNKHFSSRLVFKVFCGAKLSKWKWIVIWSW